MSINSKITSELLDHSNVKNYKQVQAYDIDSFTYEKIPNYIVLTLKTIGDDSDKDISIVQISGPSVILEKISSKVYRYLDPEDEVETPRVFQALVKLPSGTIKSKNLTVNIIVSSYYLTSSIYPITVTESIKAFAINKVAGRFTNDLYVPSGARESLKPYFKSISGTFKIVLLQYLYRDTLNPFEGMTLSFKNIEGVFKNPLRTYDKSIDSLNISFKDASGLMRRVLIEYLFYKYEGINIGVKNIALIENKVLENTFKSYIKASVDNPVIDDITIEDPTEITNEIEEEPTVTIIPSKTTSALNFENGLTDGVPSTIWALEGSAAIDSTNKIFGSSSVKTSALGDSVYTNSQILTGGSTPYTVEFYAVLKGLMKGSSSANAYPLFYKNHSSGGGEQGFYVSYANNLGYHVYNGSSWKEAISSDKVDIAARNKFTFTYDGSAIRAFVNDKLYFVFGASVGMEINTHTQPYRFLRCLVPNYPEYQNQTIGIIDNINVHDGIATKVRQYDQHEDKLIVDLDFDGENNSTTIIDNAFNTIKIKDPYIDNISSLLQFNDSNLLDRTGTAWTTVGNFVTTKEQIPFTESSSGKFNTGAYIRTANDSKFLFSASDDFTIETWVYNSSTETNGIDDEWPIIAAGYQNTSNIGGGWNLALFDKPTGTMRLERVTNTGGAIPCEISIGKALPRNEWFHIAVCRKAGTIYMFVDGELIGTSEALKNLPLDNPNNLPILVGSGYGTSENYYQFKGYLNNLRITKGVARYTSNFILPTEPFIYGKKNTWTVSGNAKLTTDQKFDGFSSLYLDGYSYVANSLNYASDLDLGLDDFTISFSFQVSSFKSYNYLLSKNYGSDRFHFSVNSTGVGVSVNSGYGVGIQTPIDIGKWYTVRFIRKGGIVYLYVNSSRAIDTTNWGSQPIKLNDSSLIIGGCGWDSSAGLNGYIDSFKIYKGVGIIPEDTSGKIQLDFDNNLNDKYDNSTWTNNGVIFDEINSNSGYAIKLDNNTTSNIRCNLNDNLNFENKDFKLTVDAKITNKQSNTALIMSGGASNYYHLLFGNSSNDFGIYHDNSTIRAKTEVYAVPSSYSLNSYYNLNISRKNDVINLYTNNVLVAQRPLDHATVYNFNNDNSTTIGSSYNSLQHFTFNGYIDNFKSIKDCQDEVVIDKPAVHLPLETNAINTSFTNLTINSIGNPTYTVVEGRKCIKFEQGNYLTIDSNNIFNLGANSDFYIEFDIYPIEDKYQHILCDGRTSYTLDIVSIALAPSYEISPYTQAVYVNTGTNTQLVSTNKYEFNKFNNIKLIRKGSIVSLILNDTKNEITLMAPLNLSFNKTILGNGLFTSNQHVNGYLSNFKMFVGTSEIPNTYNDKAVLDLDFKPINASYLFKDNNNKCVIHPVNITQRDYIDSRYACTFNGTNQYIQFGKNELFNFGNDDFIINIKFKVNSLTNSWNWNCLLADNTVSTNWIDIASDGKLCVKLGGNRKDSAQNIIQENILYNLLLIMKDNILQMFLNNQIIALNSNISNTFTDVNFNYGNNTYIGSIGYNQTDMFNGSIYSIKVFRNTSDLSLIGDTNNTDPYSYLDFETDVTRDAYLPNWTTPAGTPSTTTNAYKGTKALPCNGTAQYLQKDIDFQNQDYLIEFYLNFNSIASSGYHYGLIDYGNGSLGTNGFNFTQMSSPGSGTPYLWLRTQYNNIIQYEQPVVTGKWYKINIKYKDSNLSLLVDDVLVGTIAITDPLRFSGNKPFFVGFANTDWKTYGDFIIDEFKIYKGVSEVPVEVTGNVVTNYDVLLKFEGNDNSTVINDSTGKTEWTNNNAIIKTSQKYSGNSSILFNGTNSYLNLPSNDLLNFGTGDFTVSFALNPTSRTNWYQTILSNGYTSFQTGCRFIMLFGDPIDPVHPHINQVNGRIAIGGEDNGDLSFNPILWSTNPIPLNEWTKVTITKKGTLLRLYINNVLDKEINTNKSFDFSYLGSNIGKNAWDGTNGYYTGYLDHFYVLKGVAIEGDGSGIIHDYFVDMERIDAYRNTWEVYSNSSGNTPVLKTNGNKESIYFNGNYSLYNTNDHRNFGLSPFTIEFNMKLSSSISNYYRYIMSSFANWDLVVYDDYSLVFKPYGVAESSWKGSANMVKLNTNHHIAITRDSNYTLRVFVDGVKLFERLDNTCYIYNNSPASSYPLSIGQQWADRASVNYVRHFNGYIDNFNLIRGECKYNSNFTPTDANVSYNPTSLLNFNNNGSYTSFNDTYNGITWTGSNNVVGNSIVKNKTNSLHFSNTTDYLLSSSYNDFYLNSKDFTIDLVLYPTQSITETVILDMRLNGVGSNKGLLLTQPSGNASSLTLQLGSSSATTAFDLTINTGVNSLLDGVYTHIRIVRNMGKIYLFMNGILKASGDYTLDIATSNYCYLGNNNLKSKGFAGYLEQFRFIKGQGISTSDFTAITKELI